MSSEERHISYWARRRKEIVEERLLERGFQEIEVNSSRDEIIRDEEDIVAIELSYIISAKHHINISQLEYILIGVVFKFDENERTKTTIDIKAFTLKDDSKRNYLTIRPDLEDVLQKYEEDIVDDLSIIGHMA